MTLHAIELDAKPAHRSFRLTRPTSGTTAQQIGPALVLPERDIRTLVTAAGRHDVSAGGCYSVGPAGVQVWSGPWDGPLGGHGESRHLGSVDWSYDTPVLSYVTVYRVMLTAAGVAEGETTTSIMNRVLGLAGISAQGESRANALPPPRDPFRSSALRRRV